MANRILKYLDSMDLLREQTDLKVDEILKKVNVELLLNDPEKALKLIVLTLIKDNSILFKQARDEGKKLATSL